MNHPSTRSCNIMRLFSVLAVLLIIPVMASATTCDIFVTGDGDRTFLEFFGYGSNTMVDQPSLQASWDSSCETRTLLHFDLSSLTVPADSIESVTLNIKLEKTSGANTGYQHNIVKLSDDANNAIGYIGRYDAWDWTSLDVTDSILRCLNNEGTAADFMFSCFVQGSGVQFASAEGGNPSFLRITTRQASAVPIPAGIWLLGPGLLGLLGLRRKLRG